MQFHWKRVVMPSQSDLPYTHYTCRKVISANHFTLLNTINLRQCYSRVLQFLQWSLLNYPFHSKGIILKIYDVFPFEVIAKINISEILVYHFFSKWVFSDMNLNTFTVMTYLTLKALGFLLPIQHWRGVFHPPL